MEQEIVDFSQNWPVFGAALISCGLLGVLCWKTAVAVMAKFLDLTNSYADRLRQQSEACDAAREVTEQRHAREREAERILFKGMVDSLGNDVKDVSASVTRLAEKITS